MSEFNTENVTTAAATCHLASRGQLIEYFNTLFGREGRYYTRTTAELKSALRAAAAALGQPVVRDNTVQPNVSPDISNKLTYNSPNHKPFI
jgi:hypothetical protein